MKVVAISHDHPLLLPVPGRFGVGVKQLLWKGLCFVIISDVMYIDGVEGGQCDG